VRQDVSFPGFGGTALHGWLYLPDTAGTVPGVVMAHGLSAVKEMALEGYAEIFCAGGLAVLVYDHRNLGASDGEPRQEINPWAQARDYRYALSWLAERPEVDGERLGVWGSSFSGGQTLVLGACDKRPKAVVANVPFAGFPGVDYGETRARFESLRAALLDESGRGPADASDTPPTPVLVVREPGSDALCILDQPESSEWFLRMGRRPDSTWSNQITLWNAFGGDPLFDPGVCFPYVSPTPLLLVVAEGDRVADVSVARAGFERAGQPKRLVEVPGHHFSPYDGEALVSAANAARDFFLEHLQGERGKHKGE